MAKGLNTSMEADRISELPTHTRQQILSLLSTRDAVVTSILSRTWRYDWQNLPSLNFRDGFPLKNWKSDAKTIRFLEFVHGCLLRGKHDDYLGIQKLYLYLPRLAELSPKTSYSKDCLKVQELLYEVPRCALTVKSLIELCLAQCDLRGSKLINLPSLRDLSMDSVHIDELLVENLISNCCSIECLRFTNCRGFKSLKVSGLPKLRKLQLTCNKDLEGVEIDAPNLDILSYTQSSFKYLFSSSILLVCVGSLTHLDLANVKTNVNAWVESNILPQLSHLKKLALRDCNALEHVGSLTSFKSLMHLELSMCEITDDWLIQNLIEFANLEDLTLAYCHRLKNVTILHNKLIILCVKGCKMIDQVEMDCPKLSCFSYCTSYANVISLSLEKTVAHTCLDLRYSLSTKDKFWHAKVLDLLMRLRNSKSLALTVYSIEDVMTIAKQLRQSHNPPLGDVKHLELSFVYRISKPLVEIMEVVLWLFPQLTTVQIRSCFTSFTILVKFKYKEMLELGCKSCGCYPSTPINCWRHSVKDFQIGEEQGFKDSRNLRRFLENSIRENLNAFQTCL